MFTNKKGYSMLEVTLSIALFSILFLTVLTLEASKIKLRAINKKKESYMQSIQAIKSYLINDISYDDLIGLYENGARYINNENIKFEIYEKGNVSQLLESNIESEEAYIDLKLNREIPAKIVMQCHINNALIKEVIICEFYKGKY